MASVNTRLAHRLDEFEAAPWRWSLSAAMSLLEQCLYPDSELPAYPDRKLAFAPAPDLSFPAADLRRLRRSESDPSRRLLECNVLALAGPNAPLPHYLLAEMQGAGREPLSDLVTLFNHRIFSLMQEAEGLASPAEADGPAQCSMLVAGGRVRGTHGGDEPGRRRIGAYRQQTRSLAGLRTAILDCWPGVDVALDATGIGLVQVDSATLGEDTVLGENTLLGEHVPVARRRLDIVLSSEQPGRLAPLYPGERDWSTLCTMIRDLLPLDVISRVIFQRPASDESGLALSGRGAALGWDTPLGQPVGRVWSLPVMVPVRSRSAPAGPAPAAGEQAPKAA